MDTWYTQTHGKYESEGEVAFKVNAGGRTAKFEHNRSAHSFYRFVFEWEPLLISALAQLSSEI